MEAEMSEKEGPKNYSFKKRPWEKPANGWIKRSNSYSVDCRERLTPEIDPTLRRRSAVSPKQTLEQLCSILTRSKSALRTFRAQPSRFWHRSSVCLKTCLRRQSVYTRVHQSERRFNAHHQKQVFLSLHRNVCRVPVAI